MSVVLRFLPEALSVIFSFGRSPRHACPEIRRAYSPKVIQTIEAIVDERGAVRLLEPVQLDRRHRALVTILADEPLLLQQPLVRLQHKLTIGLADATWKEWLSGG